MADDNLRLIEPSVELETEYRDYIEEFRAAGEPFRQDDPQQISKHGGFAAYVDLMRMWARGEELPADHVPAETYWLVRGQRILGTIRLRHKLNEHLLEEGGHIGYDVRPSERGKGYATRMLRDALEKAREIHLRRVLVTCNKDNRASARVIVKNGGVWEDDRVSPDHGKLVSRYWIELDAPPPDSSHGGRGP